MKPFEHARLISDLEAFFADKRSKFIPNKSAILENAKKVPVEGRAKPSAWHAARLLGHHVAFGRFIAFLNDQQSIAAASAE